MIKTKALILVLMVVLATGCSQEKRAASEATIAVRPGDSIEVTVEAVELARGDNIAVLIGGRMSHYVSVVDAHTMEVRVPLLPSGITEVEVRIKGQSFAGPTLDVTALSHLSVAVFAEADTVTIISVDPTDDPLPSSPAPTSVARISYDFFSEDGSVSIMTTLPHPLGEDHVVVGGGHGSHGDDAGDDGHDHGDHTMSEPFEFTVIVPKVQGRAILRIFEAKADLDLSEPHNAHSRKLLGEFLLPLQRD